MKIKVILLACCIPFCSMAQTGNVGIGTASPQARLHVTDSSVVFSATGNIPGSPGNPPIQGAGRRMMWYPDKAAFRAGYVDNTQWDNSNIGLYSHVIGNNSIASWISSVAIGMQDTASNLGSFALGNYNRSSGSNAMVFGNSSIASADYSMTLGSNLRAITAYETVLGRWNTSPGTFSNSWNPTDRLFVIGNGTAEDSKSDALVMLKNGNTGIGIANPAIKFHVGFGTTRIEGPQSAGSVALSVGGFGEVRVDAPGIAGGRITIKENGHVGIGTNNPGYPLNFASLLGDKIALWGNAGAHYGFGVQSGLLQLHTDDAAASIQFGYGSSTSFTERMRMYNSGESGLLLNGRLVLKNGTVPLDPAYGAGIWMYRGDNAGILGFMGVQNNQNLGFYGGPGGWGFTYDAVNSRVGIGNNNPNAPLSFGAQLGRKITLYPSGVGNYGLSVHNNELRIHSDDPSSIISFGQENLAGAFTERARFINAGVDGLSMKGRLVLGNGLLTDPNPGIMLLNLDNSSLQNFVGLANSNDQFGIYSYTGAGWGIVMNNNNGNVGIGNGNPTQRLHVSGNILASGTITPSDLRYKKDVHVINDALTRLQQLNGVTYYMNSDTAWKFDDKLQYGVIAQEVEKVFPEMVTTIDEKGYKGVEYTKLIPVLIESIKDQQKMIEELKKQNEIQQKQIDQLLKNKG